MPHLRFAYALAVLLLMADTAAAQFPAGRGAIRGGGSRSPVAPPPPGAVGLFAIDPVEPGRPVLNLPYTAEAVTEMDQLLPDGTRTKRRTSAAIARDSRGRVRREHASVMLGPFVAERSVPLVTVSDPGAGTQLLIDPERKVATFTRVPPGAGGASPPDGDPRGRMRALGEQAATTSPLGFQSIEGIMAEGSRTAMTIAGRRAGGSPTAVISERWYSHELQVVVMTKRSDPRFGETTYRLTNITLAEPPMELFEVPSGYTVTDRPVGLPGMRGPVR